jgi:hypothetical protein
MAGPLLARSPETRHRPNGNTPFTKNEAQSTKNSL